MPGDQDGFVGPRRCGQPRASCCIPSLDDDSTPDPQSTPKLVNSTLKTTQPGSPPTHYHRFEMILAVLCYQCLPPIFEQDIHSACFSVRRVNDGFHEHRLRGVF